MRIRIHVIKTQLDVPAIARYPDRPKDIVPNGECQPVIDAVAAFRQFLGVMPDVHLRAVENVFQRPQWQVNIRMVQVTNNDGKQVDDDKILNTKTDHGQRQIFNGSVHKCFHKMKAQMGRKAHFPHRVMHFVEFPQPWRPMQQSVGVPLDKITHQE